MTSRSLIAKWLRTPFGARAAGVVAVIVVLALVAGLAVVTQVTDQMRRDADARLDGHAADVAGLLEETMASASSDIRLARRNEIFEAALEGTQGQLLAADRAKVEAAITYLGDRYQVDEICLIRANGLEAARWVGGEGVAPVDDLSPDERVNNPAVVPTLALADDSFFQSEPYVSPDSGRWVIGIATPIILASGEHAGILHFEIPIARFAATLDRETLGGTSYNVLLDRSGRLLVHPQLAAFRSAAGVATDMNTGPFPQATASGSASWRDAVGRIVSGQVGTVSFDDGGRTYRVSYRPIADSDRIVAVVSPVGELYADVDRALLNLAATAGPLILLMILVTGWFARRMSRANRGLGALNDRLASANARLEETSRSSAELASESAIINQFTELTALTEDDVSLSVATLATLDELLRPTAAALHVSNRSQDRAVPQATLGEDTAEVLSLHELGRCPALRRGSLYVTNDVSARLSFHCPVYPVENGTLACVPLVALGETVGAIHLHWAEVHELSLPLRLAITRVSEHAALSIANRRLLFALRGQANTDGRTGLTNSRAFDEALEQRLANRPENEPLAVLMLDLDHFKEFNDRYGHPAGDEALRAFAHLLATSVRENDVAARYGGEEFAIYLPGLDATAAIDVAERIRERTESTIIPLGPGQTGHLTVSIGIAAAPENGAERVTLLKSADEALYRAKLAGRNRVVSQGGWRSGQGSLPNTIDAEEHAPGA
ncbi:MAG TPA: diguanylate cyclase [Candidatus Limnocylindrales bacterium]|nr:diguanylate cyclase [Candidatus Limnocylindrales bacterium]